MLVVFAVQSDDGSKIASAIVFGVSLIIMYGSSTLYHTIHHPEIKAIFRQVDHCSIYLLIAGTYTPLTLLGIQGTFGWTLFGIVWGVSALGIMLKIFFRGRFHYFSIVLYALLGWMVVVAMKPLLANIDSLTLSFLLTGGIIYTIGIFFYAWKRLYFSHAIWHFFVLAGSISHFFMVLRLID